MTGVLGDTAALRELAAQFGTLARGSFQRTLARDLAGRARIEARESILSATDPYGAPWAPRKKRGDGHPLLLESQRLFRSFQTHPTADGFELTSSVPYAAAHQDGATIPARAYANAHGKNGRFKRQGRARNPFSARGARTITLGTIGPTVIPARPFLPDAARGLGPRWTASFEAAAAHRLGVVFGMQSL